MIRHSCRIISRKNTRTLYIHVWCNLFNISPLRQRRMESDAEDRCRYGRCRRNHSRKMPFRSKFCYISNSSYICIAVPGVPLSDVSADDESGFFSFYKSNTFFGLCRLRGMLSLPVPLRLCSRRAILRCRDDCLQTELFFCAATTAADGTILLCR